MRGYIHSSSYYMPVEVSRFFKWAVDIMAWKLPADFPNGISDSVQASIIRTDVSQFPGGITAYDAEHDEKIREIINTDTAKETVFKAQKPKGKRGMKSINSDDFLVAKMLKKIRDDNCHSISAAAEAFIKEAGGAGSDESKQRRLCRKFTIAHGSDLNILRQ